MSLQFWLAVLAYVVPLFPLAYSWHLSTFAKAYDSLEIYREKPIIPFGLASMLLQGVIFAWIFPQIFDTTANWVVNGLKFAAIFGVLAWTFNVLPVAAKNRMNDVGKFIRLETGFTIVSFLVTGLLIALVYRAV